ncbi:MAG: hypothetical protein K0R51_575 [Cytophagaceae bacterium]|jgi:cytoskeletal protein RodZ|nr:hypothetical protein [Cytophagaceae bacterium]
MELQEKIDQYLLDQLSPADKTKFEQLIAGDSHLKSEVALQQSVVTALGNTRSMQLKARMQKIPVSMASTGNALRLKWIGIATTGAVAAGLIIFFLTGTGQEKNTESAESSSIQQTTSTEISPAVVPTIESTTPSAESQTEKAEQAVVVKKQKNTGTVAPSNEIKAFDNSANFDDIENGNVTTPNAENSSAPANTLYTETNNKLSNLSVTVDNSNSKDKSYQFTGSKLTLFGDFNNKPYELLELNNKGQKNLFLSYNNEYYELVWGQMKKTPLKKVSHKETLEKLKVINP